MPRWTATFLVRAFDLAAAEPAGFADTAGNTHETNIDALAAARVTAGCKTDPLRYCPDRSVTRSQMATFLARALGLVEVPTPTEDTSEEEPAALPGEGVDVTASRTDLPTGYFQAELFKQLLEELGYNVSDPADRQFGLNDAYFEVAWGTTDYWPHAWLPAHLPWISSMSDRVTIVGEQTAAGGLRGFLLSLQGFLINKSFADEYGVYTVDELNSNVEALAAFDATDPVPGNGVADIFSCQASWTCDSIVENQIAFGGWDNIARLSAGYNGMFAQAVDSVDRGIPMVFHTWAPSTYIAQLRPGDNVYWLGVESILDDSNPAGLEGGEHHDQRGMDGTGGFAAVGADQCPSAADNPDGLCPIGWLAADILVAASNDFLAANPAAKALFEAVELSVIDVSLANVAQDQGESPSDLATQWIADNRDLVDEWIAAARAAA